ncbi:hypothetical protein IC620_14505 [Hazenella sp. IB182357]|uniref:Uncharacterized protein n=1 Tax=Polycladospora coralii TaxID=2771432 RepID=A0A926NC58_9BACL|nr:hypothetical protein [Polycladospora coralii]MBD1373557.1 hypothetical protein [Polycladospora coralii]MBS7531926.1 hypothetical protein [Polycladospora coralii]
MINIEASFIVFVVITIIVIAVISLGALIWADKTKSAFVKLAILGPFYIGLLYRSIEGIANNFDKGNLFIAYILIFGVIVFSTTFLFTIFFHMGKLPAFIKKFGSEKMYEAFKDEFKDELFSQVQYNSDKNTSTLRLKKTNWLNMFMGIDKEDNQLMSSFNSNIAYRLGSNSKICQLEFSGEPSERLKNLDGQDHVFRNGIYNNDPCYQLLVSESPIMNSYKLQAHNVVILFEDEEYQYLLGVIVRDIDHYDKSYMIGDKNL